MHRHEQASSQSRHDLAGEHFITDIGQLVLLIIFLAVWITDSFLFHYTDFPARYIPVYIRLSIAVATLIVSIFGSSRNSVD